MRLAAVIFAVLSTCPVLAYTLTGSPQSTRAIVTTTTIAPSSPTTTAPSTSPIPAALPVPIASTTTTAPASLGASPEEVDAWQQTAICEESGNNDPSFGYYGIYPSTWRAFGGTAFAPVAGQASKPEQVEIGMRIEGHPPDQGGCQGSW